MSEKKISLTEAARIARGDLKPPSKPIRFDGESDPIHSVPAAAPEAEKRACPNCHAPLTKEGHFVPPIMGDPGFFICTPAASSPAPVAPAEPVIEPLPWTAEEALEALRLACNDAWPNQQQWPGLYLQQARANLHLRERKTTTPVFEIYCRGAEVAGWDFWVCREGQEATDRIAAALDDLEEGQEVRVIFRRYTPEQMSEVVYE